MEESLIAMFLAIFVFMCGFTVARLSSDQMTIKECLQSTVILNKAKAKVEGSNE